MATTGGPAEETTRQTQSLKALFTDDRDLESITVLSDSRLRAGLQAVLTLQTKRSMIGATERGEALFPAPGHFSKGPGWSCRKRNPEPMEKEAGTGHGPGVGWGVAPIRTSGLWVGGDLLSCGPPEAGLLPRPPHSWEADTRIRAGPTRAQVPRSQPSVL